jgi:Flp pilus assembly protein TadD
LDGARAACDAVLAIQDDLNTRVRRGIIAYRQGRFQDAWMDFDAGARLDPESGLPRYGRGLAAGKLGRNGEADIAAAIAHRPGVVAEYEAYGIPP